jgi:hypothetical protein
MPTSTKVDPVQLPKGRLGAELLQLLERKNGFYAFEAACQFFPAGPSRDEPSLAKWNSRTLWKGHYAGLAEGIFCFAQDIFGGQFVIKEEDVGTFDPETGDFVAVASSLDAFAGLLLDDYRVLTGQPVAHEWRQLHGRISSGSRLIPKRPFVLGGDFSVSNMIEIEMVRGMKIRADLALQIKDLPDGAKITYKLTD